MNTSVGESRERIGRPHIAHLRAVAQGLSVQQAARQFLLIESNYAAVQEHKSIVDRARAIARQAGHKDWRLIGIEIHRQKDAESSSGPRQSTKPQPNLDEWAEQNGLDGWSQDELLAMYCTAFPNEQNSDQRKIARNARLLERQLAVVNLLETTKAAKANTTDNVGDWFDRETTKRFRNVGVFTLGDLQDVIARQQRWWRLFRGIGEAKGERIKSFVRTLLPVQEKRPAPWVVDPPELREEAAKESLEITDQASVNIVLSRHRKGESIDGSAGWNRADSKLLSANNDLDAIESWIAARGVNAVTTLSYRREAKRAYLWCLLQRKKTLSAMNVEDCAAFTRFLAAIPKRWIGKKVPVKNSAYWAPFATQLSAASQRQTLTIVRGMFAWMRQAGYLMENPWASVRTKVAADEQDIQAILNSRALTPSASQALRSFFATLKNDEEGKKRAEFCVSFFESTGLRATELLKAKLGNIKKDSTGVWCLPVKGKGDKPRVVTLTPMAIDALEKYLEVRELPSIDECLRSGEYRDLPIVPSLIDRSQHVGYRALFQSLTTIIRRAIDASDLPREERLSALRASPHWLRHTFATRAKERDVSNVVLMVQMGHSTERPLARYTKAQRHRVNEELGRAFSSSST
jgi:integrase